MIRDSRDIAWRIGGVAVLCAAGGIDRLHDWLLASGRPRSASLDVFLGLSGFILAMFGAILIMHGPRLHDRWRKLLAGRSTDQAAPSAPRSRAALPQSIEAARNEPANPEQIQPSGRFAA